jgi:hypothetical protein
VDPRLQEEIDRQEEANRQAAADARAKEIRRSYLGFFTSSDGRNVLSDLRVTFYDRICHVPGDPYGTHVAEGMRQVVLRILTIMAQESDAPKETQPEAET